MNQKRVLKVPSRWSGGPYKEVEIRRSRRASRKSQGMAGGGLTFPYTFDPTGLSEFPAGWTAPTYTISSDVISNSPTLGAELLTDPGLEGTYTGGFNENVTATGGTGAQSADVHGGSKAQEWTPTADFQGISAQITPTAQRWYKLIVWSKRAAGAAGKIYSSISQNMVGYSRAHSDAAYTQKGAVAYTDNTAALTASLAAQGSGAADTVVLDDMSLKLITTNTLFALVNAGSADVTTKARYTTWDVNGYAGVVARADSTNPTSYLIAYYAVSGSIAYTFCVLDKVVNGVRTNLIGDFSNSPAAGSGGAPTSTQWLEIRCSGTTVQLFHNDIQVGTNQTVSDASILNNTYHGLFNTGGSTTNLFFVG